MMHAVFVVLGILVAVTEVLLLAKRAQEGSNVLWFILRFALVVVFLGTAAITGYLLAGAAGWAAGFAVTAFISYRRMA